MDEIKVKPHLVIFEIFKTSSETGEEIKTDADDIVAINCSEILTISNGRIGFHGKILQNCVVMTIKNGGCYQIRGNVRDIQERILRS
jgi:hypothetical protein